MDVLDWISRQIDAPGALAALIQAISVLAALVIAIAIWRKDRRRERQAVARETAALAEIADHACDLVMEVADALRDEVNVGDFVDRFDRRALIDADLMLDAVPPQALPSLTLLRPLFELRWTVERSLEVADWITEAVGDPSRQGWRETAGEMSSLVERAVLAADAFRGFARRGKR